jgi:hypothetical protein
MCPLQKSSKHGGTGSKQSNVTMTLDVKKMRLWSMTSAGSDVIWKQIWLLYAVKPKLEWVKSRDSLHSMFGGDVESQVELVIVTWFCLHHVNFLYIPQPEATSRLLNADKLVTATRYFLRNVVLFTSCDRERRYMKTNMATMRI